VSPLVDLALSKHQVTDVEVSSANVFVMVASEILLTPCRVQYCYIASFLELVKGVLSCDIVALLVVGFQPWGPIL
jgi:hypothetical protein